MRTAVGLAPRSAPSSGEAAAVGAAIEIIACRDCGLVHRLPSMADRTTAECTRCGAVLYRRVHDTIDRALACYVGALILFHVANASPILTLTLEGRTEATTIVAGARALWDVGEPALAAVVLLAGTLLPLAKILGTLYVLVALRLGLHPPGLAPAFRWMRTFGRWAMMEVYLLGLIVAYVKLGDMATVGLGLAAAAFVALILMTLAGDLNLDPHAVWTRIEPQAGPDVLGPPPGVALVSCHACEQIFRAPGGEEDHGRCPRCGARLHRRKPESVARTWAFLATAAILYVPANLLPIMTVVYLGSGAPSTILEGVRSLLVEGMVPVALLVLFASVVVPVVKVVGLGWLLVSVRRRSTWRLRDRTLLYRIIDGVGRWSMVDIFMIAILTALVRLGNLASVEPEAGAVAFAAVVIATILAAEAFDPRLIWDVLDDRPGREAAPSR